ncbi:hypothetical protein, partial [uncultured Bartonella sp.]|uniref:hypothetical protein n=1 Tax=uncultured Bartonella sp. TaxID=104108 RepID=UPI00260387C1
RPRPLLLSTPFLIFFSFFFPFFVDSILTCIRRSFRLCANPRLTDKMEVLVKTAADSSSEMLTNNQKTGHVMV